MLARFKKYTQAGPLQEGDSTTTSMIARSVTL